MTKLRSIAILALLGVASFCLWTPVHVDATAYGTKGAPLMLAPKMCAQLYNAERPLTGTFSIQFNSPRSDQQPSTNLSFTLSWPTDPGAFNIQIQDADIDATGNYVTVTPVGTITSAPQAAGSGNFIARVELNPWQAQYGRLFVNTQSANVVNLTATVCR